MLQVASDYLVKQGMQPCEGWRLKSKCTPDADKELKRIQEQLKAVKERAENKVRRQMKKKEIGLSREAKELDEQHARGALRAWEKEHPRALKEKPMKKMLRRYEDLVCSPLDKAAGECVFV